MMSTILTFKTISLSIILEALPFMLLGVVFSSILQVFVKESTIQRWMPRNPILGIGFACLLGILFPLCECGMIPVIRRLLRKGMPLYVAIVFIVVGPVLNPIVFASTWMAFRQLPEMAYARMGLAFAVAVVIGLGVWKFVRSNPLRDIAIEHALARGEGDHATSSNSETGGWRTKLSHLFAHFSDEFFEMGKYLLLGSFITAGIQTFIAREWIVSVGQGPVWSHIVMMGFAFLLSLCSTSDAFVASSFATTFSKGSLLTFLVFGPMVDFKSVLMLRSTFRASFVWRLCVSIAIAVLVGSMLLERILFR